jgi:hypothetical protein
VELLLVMGVKMKKVIPERFANKQALECNNDISH